MALFDSVFDYYRFKQHVCHEARYFLGEEAQAFLAAVRESALSRSIKLPAGSYLYRAQVGPEQDQASIPNLLAGPTAHPAERMFPRKSRATEGRANPAGVPVMYLASDVDTCLNEVRPLVGANVSVGTFEVLKELRIVDLTAKHEGNMWDIFTRDELQNDHALIDANKIMKFTWRQIDEAFAVPVTRADDRAEYVPTQILSELFRSMKFDGIRFRSQFSDAASNYALFGRHEMVRITACQPYQVMKVTVTAIQAGPGYSQTPS